MNMMSYFKLIVPWLLLPLLLFGGGFSKVGTTAAPFLKIGAGARAVALGGNFVALANDATALYWNPAGITAVGSVSISGTHTEWFADISHDFVALVAPLGNQSALGVDFIYLGSGDIEQTTVDEQDGNGIFYRVTDLALGLTYARRLTDRFSVAFKGKFIRQKIFREEASSFALDFGTLFDTGFKGLRIGMNLANFGKSMQMDGSDLAVLQDNSSTGESVETRLKTESWPLPVVFRVGIALDIVGNENGLTLSNRNRLTLTVDGTHPNDNKETVGTGLEYVWNDLLALRGGYLYNHDVQDFTFGGGLNLVVAGWRVNIDYAYANFGDLNSIQRFTIGFAF
ncbi:MAG: PorV/PorQ family protein [Calditrichia bacterium]